MPQPPQLRASVCVSVHTALAPVPQRVRGEAQSTTHAPATQLWPVMHALPHEPQLALLDCVSTHMAEAPEPQSV